MQDGPVHEWLRGAHETSTWTASVCTGSLILAAAGLLEGRRATSNWQALDELRELGVEVVPERVVFDGKLATSAGVTAGIDMALTLVGRIAGPELAQAIQLGIEYDPEPPFDAGSPEKAPAEIVEAVRAYSRFTDRAGAADVRFERMSDNPFATSTSSKPAGLSVFDAHAGEREASSTFLLGQVMFLVAVALAFFAGGTYIGRDLSYGTGLIFELGALGMLIVQMFVPKLREGPTGMTWMFALALLLGLGLGPVINQYARSIRARSTRPRAAPR